MLHTKDFKTTWRERAVLNPYPWCAVLSNQIGHYCSLCKTLHRNRDRTPRGRSGGHLGSMYILPPRDAERYCLRILLLNTTRRTSFEDLRMHQSAVTIRSFNVCLLCYCDVVREQIIGINRECALCFAFDVFNRMSLLGRDSAQMVATCVKAIRFLLYQLTTTLMRETASVTTIRSMLCRTRPQIASFLLRTVAEADTFSLTDQMAVERRIYEILWKQTPCGVFGLDENAASLLPAERAVNSA
ncbi:hypothetical protein COOONC_03452 [Cooperia oncophora]